jgi:hypothetical protein
MGYGAVKVHSDPLDAYFDDKPTKAKA